jgi:hypothetical protein
MANSVYVHFEGLSRPLQLIGCSELLDRLPLIFPGWNIDTQTSPTQTPIIKIELEKEGNYRLEAEWLKEAKSYRDEVDTLVCPGCQGRQGPHPGRHEPVVPSRRRGGNRWQLDHFPQQVPRG